MALLCAITLGASASLAQTGDRPLARIHVGVILDRAVVDDSFIRGFRRPFLQQTLPVERQQGRGKWLDAGSVPNGLVLARALINKKVADSLEIVALNPSADSVSDFRSDIPPEWRQSEDGSGYSFNMRDPSARLVLWVRVGSRQSQMLVCYVGKPGDPPPEPEIDPQGVTVQVAICARESLGSPSLEWTPMMVWWRENPSSSSRAQEIHGWITGMAALQIAHRRLGLMPDSLDLVFESRGRNH